MSLQEIADNEQRTIDKYYLSRDEEEVNESDELLTECSKLLDDEIAHNQQTVESNRIKELLQSGHSLKFTTRNGDNAASLCALQSNTEVLVEIIRSGNDRFVLRPNQSGRNCIGSYLRNEIQLDSVNTVVRTLIQCNIVSKSVLAVIILHQWIKMCMREHEHNCRSLSQVLTMMNKFDIFNKLTTDRDIDDLELGRELRECKKQMEIIARLIHPVIQRERAEYRKSADLNDYKELNQYEKLVARVKQLLIEQLNVCHSFSNRDHVKVIENQWSYEPKRRSNLPETHFLPDLRAANQLTKRISLPEAISTKLVARSSHYISVMRSVPNHDEIKPTAHMFIVGGFVQAWVESF